MTEMPRLTSEWSIGYYVVKKRTFDGETSQQ